MNIKNNKVREALKLIPSIDEILKQFKNSSSNILKRSCNIMYAS